ncbi:hypothetical protein VPHD481_0100 [Vibrio phage D481]
MLGTFDSFLSENRRQTQGGKIYPKFGQVFVELGTASTDFSKEKGVETTIGMMEKANELKSIMQSKLFEDSNVDHTKFDMNLSENVSVINLLMEEEFLACKPTELAQLKSMTTVSEARMPSLVVKGGELTTIVSEATKLGYKKSDIHVIFPMAEMKIELADSDKLVVEALSFDGRTATEILAMGSRIQLGDVYVVSESVESNADVLGLEEIRINRMTLGALNRHVMNCFVVKEAAETSYAHAAVKEITDRPALSGFKAYDLKPNVTMLEHAQNAFSKDIAKAPLSATAWEKLVDVKEVYFDNGWKLKHNNTSLVLTNAENAMRHGRVCEEYRVELSEAGYPLLDMIAMMERNEEIRWDCASFAKHMMKFDGAITPERQSVTAFTTESASNRVFHPHVMSDLRPVTEAADDVDSLIRAIANDQFSSFKISQAFSEQMLDQETLYSMMESIVSEGIDVDADGDLITFKVNATQYHIQLDIK